MQTALSQHYNLLFVACQDQIHIFQPTFPEQKLPKGRAHVFRYGRSGHPGHGYIDPSKPHAANHILVGDLGSEEILLIACDDGDVIGYKTRCLLPLVEGAHSKKHNPTPFFKQNVGRSAWGLSIHTESRLIAVSSNTHQILIFAFALVTATLHNFTNCICEQSKSFDFGDSFRCDTPPISLRSPKNIATPAQPPRKDRHQDLVFALSEHVANVPNIYFYQSSSPCSSVYLASIDIDGEVVVRDVWTRRVVFENPMDPPSICKSPSFAEMSARSYASSPCDKLVAVGVSSAWTRRRLGSPGL